MAHGHCLARYAVAPMTTAAATAAPPALTASRWALLFGNFAIGCGVMVVAGSLNDLTHSLHISTARSTA